jgi:hypothetical protein
MRRNIPFWTALAHHTKDATMSMQGDAIERGEGNKPDSNQGVLLDQARAAARDAAARLSDAAQAAGREAKDAASGLASEAGQNVKGLLNDQIAVGAELAGHVAAATRAAADNLAPRAPQLAGLVRNAAHTMDDLSRTMRDRSVDELIQAASDFTRRQPAVVFGAAALAGFFLFRVLKAGGEPSEGTRHGT